MPCYPCVHCNRCGMYDMNNDLVCKSCGAVLLPGRRDCAECGTPIGAAGADTSSAAAKPAEDSGAQSEQP